MIELIKDFLLAIPGILKLIEKLESWYEERKTLKANAAKQTTMDGAIATAQKTNDTSGIEDAFRGQK
jgi:hypothetical protein